VTSKPDFKVMVLLLVFMQLTRDLFAIAKFLYYFIIQKCVAWWRSSYGVVYCNREVACRFESRPLRFTCNTGQVVHTRVPLFTKQYKLVPAQAGS